MGARSKNNFMDFIAASVRFCLCNFLGSSLFSIYLYCFDTHELGNENYDLESSLHIFNHYYMNMLSALRAGIF